MTAASGLVHEEFHGRDFARRGGMLEMVQLWVNLPARDKMSPPRYQSISNSQIPAVNLPGKQGVVRVIAGRFDGVEGPAHTFTPVNVWDLRLDGAREMDLAVPEGHTTLLAVLKGSLCIDSGDTSSETVNAAEVARFDPEGEHIRIESAQNAIALLLSGEPIREPIVGSGPFVMNNAEEIRQAMVDYQSGRMGQVS
jgi:redox-sensitive bicupin YhaK (pirin superfamily)